MSKMKNHAMDTEALRMLQLCNEISNARDEYREEMFRLRDLNDEMLAVLKDAEKHCGVIRLDALRTILAKAGTAHV